MASSLQLENEASSQKQEPEPEPEENNSNIKINPSPQPTASLPQTDVILAMREPYMQQIIEGKKTYEFRKYRLKPSIQRIWFYHTAPYSSLQYIAEIEPAVTRNPGDALLSEEGLGNKELNERHRDWEGYDYAYRILSVYKLGEAITLEELKAEFGFKGAPRGMVYLPVEMGRRVDWRGGVKVLGE